MDLPTLLEFEQNLTQAERPFDPTIKNGHINYYNIAEMIEANDVEVGVVELDNNIIGSGYPKIEVSKPYLKNERHAYLGFMYSPQLTSLYTFLQYIDNLLSR